MGVGFDGLVYTILFFHELFIFLIMTKTLETVESTRESMSTREYNIILRVYLHFGLSIT